MSAAVTQQYLQLFDEDLVDGDVGPTSRSSVTCKGKNGTSKKGVQKRRRQMKKQQRRRQEENLVMKNKLFVKSTIEKYKLQQSEDLTTDSLKQIQEISRVCKTSSKVTKTVVDQNRGRLAKDNPTPEIPQQTNTVFTDRDFDKFEQEYDFFS